MCGRYYIDAGEMYPAIKRVLEEMGGEGQAVQGEVYPGTNVPVIGREGAQWMRWGFAGYGNRVINARSETALEKNMFRNSILERRCLIPASGYYEWRRNKSGGKGKQKYALFRPGAPTFMAGIWRRERGMETPCFVILTREAAPSIAQIHDRMPLILPEEIWPRWLGGGGDPSEMMARGAKDILCRPVS